MTGREAESHTGRGCGTLPVVSDQPAQTPHDDTAEFELLVAAHERRLGEFLVQMLANRELAEDALQETFLVAFRERERLPEIENPTAWLYAVARNRALHSLRTDRRRENGIRQLIQILGRATGQDEPSDIVAVRDLLERHLDPDDRALLILRYLHGFDSSELGAIFGTSAAAIRQRLIRIRRRLEAAVVDTQVADVPTLAPTQAARAGISEYRADDNVITPGHASERRLLRLLAPLFNITPATRRAPEQILSWDRIRRHVRPAR